MITRETIDKIFDAVRVEEVIGDFVQLKRSGSNLKGLSPFTNEKTPSFMVSPAKQIWKDFSSGKGGNAVSFLMEHEHYTYPEALRYLARKYGIEVVETQRSDEEIKSRTERESMYVLTEFARDFFHRYMREDEMGKAVGLSYFKERGYRDETIDAFQLGYAPDRQDAFTKTALEKGYRLEYLVKTGLTIDKGDRKLDRFRGRVIFPIHSMSGRVLGFAGRILKSGAKAAKYVNSPASEIYDKSKILYGIYHAKQSIAKQDNCFLVEGYTDVITLYQSGITNVVASSGTALTPQQIRLIKRLTDNITVLFDGDEAGIRASLRGIDLLLEQGMNVRVVLFPGGEDPDSYARKVGSEELKSYLDTGSSDFIHFKISLFNEEARKDPVQKTRLAHDIIRSIAVIPDRIKREVYTKECARLMDISEEVLFADLSRQVARYHKEKARQALREEKTVDDTLTVVQPRQETYGKIDRLEVLESEVLRLLLNYGNLDTLLYDYHIRYDEDGEWVLEKFEYESKVVDDIIKNLQKDEIAFSRPVFSKIFELVLESYRQHGKVEVEEILKRSGAALVEYISEIVYALDEKYSVSQNWSKKSVYVTPRESQIPTALRLALIRLRIILIDKLIEERHAKLQDNGTGEPERKQLLDEIQSYLKVKNVLKSKFNLSQI